jgi:rsbT co-antagonist protein RsbR
MNKEQERKVSVGQQRIDRMVEVLSYASVGSFDEALEIAGVDGQDEFGALEEALRLVVAELHQARDQNEKAMQALERSRSELADKLETIENQRLAIQDLSTPILDIWDDVVTLPIIGAIDTRRAVEMTERLLSRIVETGSRCVIIDLTGVEVVDSMTADHLIKMTRAVRLLGCFCVITGIGPEIARTLVELDLNLGGIATLRNLKTGLEACFAHLGRGTRAAGRRQESAPRESRSGTK